MLGDKKKIAMMILASKMKPEKEEAEVEEESDEEFAKGDAAQGFLDAIESKSPKQVLKAFKILLEYCEGE